MKSVTVVLVVYLICSVEPYIWSRVFKIEMDKMIPENSDSVFRLQSRSEIGCAKACLQRVECRRCSFIKGNDTCVLDCSNGTIIQTDPSPNTVTMYTDFHLQECSDLPSTYGSGIYRIYPTSSVAFDVYCDMDTDGGGWTVFQQRLNGSVDFFRNWSDYEVGFGNLMTEFWLGNEKISQITSSGNHKLRFDLEDFDGDSRYALYDSFSVGDSTTNYKLDVSGYSGTLGDSFQFHDNRQFSTYDRDHDTFHNVHCAQLFKGGWWYAACHSTNLNGLYLSGTHTSFGDGMIWHAWRGYYYSYKTTKMMIKRHT